MTLRPRCPGCERPFHPRARVPLDALGNTGLCIDCRADLAAGKFTQTPRPPTLFDLWPSDEEEPTPHP